MLTDFVEHKLIMQRTAVTFFDTQKRSRRKTIFYQKISYNEIISLNSFRNYYLLAQNFNNQALKLHMPQLQIVSV